MFRSLVREVVFPQAEHARLAATIAYAWDVESYPIGGLALGPFVEGVALHDRGYGQLDEDAIGEVAEDRWLAIQEAGFAPEGHDPTVDLVVAMHVHRLVDGPSGGTERQALAERMATALPALREAAGAGEAEARDADRVTNLCDRISFDFCEERPADGAVEVRTAGGTLVPIGYRLDGGRVTLDPWPLRVSELREVVAGYHTDGYPDVPRPAITLFSAAP
jgi:hypothetical protein